MDENKRLRVPLIIATIVLGIIFLFGLRWVFTLANANPTTEDNIFYLFDYAVGLTMIFLPCTLPLAFVIVPLAMGKGYARGFGIALSFALGVTITLSFYGAFLGWVGGQVIGQSASALGNAQTQAQMSAENIKNYMYMIAGALGILFAFGDIGLPGFRMPTYGGAFPGFIQRQQEFVKAGLLGLFLGNIGVGCPNPLFNAVIVPQILLSGGMTQGWLIMLVQALGRVTPLFLLAFLAILGVNATSFLVAHRGKVEKITGWAMVFVAGFLFTLGAFTHDWYVYSGIHTYLEGLTQEEWITTILGKSIGQLGHTHAVPAMTPWLQWGSYVMVTIWLIPFVWIWQRRRKEVRALPDSDLLKAEKTLSTRRFLMFIIAFGALLYVVFGSVLPNRFLQQSMSHPHMMPSYQVVLRTEPSTLVANKSARLIVALKDDKGAPLQKLEVEHERLVHTIIVSEDMQYFAHVHTEDSMQLTSEMQQKGEFPVDIKLPKAGKYFVAVNFLQGGVEGVVRGELFVSGDAAPVTFTRDRRMEQMFGDTQVLLTSAPGEIRSGEAATLNYRIYDQKGNPISDLTAYLGAPMHLAIWSLDGSYFLHTHGSVPQYGHAVPAGVTFGPDISVPVTFPWPGIYKVFGQFARDGKVYTSAFQIEVKTGSNVMGAMMEGHAHTH